MKPIIERIDTWKSPLEVFELFKDKDYSFFLDSGTDPIKLGRFSFIGFDPFLILRSKKNFITIDHKGEIQEFCENPFFVLKSLLKEFRIDYRLDSAPFYGGAVGYFSYDLKDFLERLPDKAEDDLGIPDLYLGFYDRVVIFDNLIW